MTTEALEVALKRNLAARFAAADALTIIFGPVEDIPDVVSWVADDPNAPPDEDLDRQTKRLRDFERGLLDHLAWGHPGGGW